MLGSKEERTEEIKRQAQELIDQAYERGFKAGKEQEQDIPFYDESVEKAYQRGLDDAWEAARKICTSVLNGGLSYNVMKSIFGTRHVDDILHENTASEAIAKIKAYEEQKKAEEEKIKVGEEVYDKAFGKAVVLEISSLVNNASLITNDGSIFTDIDVRGIQKTGRSFPQISEVLKQLQEGE